VSSPRLTTVIGVVALGFLGSIVLFAQGNAAAAAIKNPVAATPQSIAAGQEAYRKNLTDDAWDHGSTDGAIFDNIKNGVPPDFNMTPWKDQMKDDEIWNVVNYLRSIAKKK
jgi:hypothetical protein